MKLPQKIVSLLLLISSWPLAQDSLIQLQTQKLFVSVVLFDFSRAPQTKDSYTLFYKSLEMSEKYYLQRDNYVKMLLASSPLGTPNIKKKNNLSKLGRSINAHRLILVQCTKVDTLPLYHLEVHMFDVLSKQVGSLIFDCAVEEVEQNLIMAGKALGDFNKVVELTKLEKKKKTRKPTLASTSPLIREVIWGTLTVLATAGFNLLYQLKLKP